MSEEVDIVDVPYTEQAAESDYIVKHVHDALQMIQARQTWFKDTLTDDQATYLAYAYNAIEEGSMHLYDYAQRVYPVWKYKSRPATTESEQQ